MDEKDQRPDDIQDQVEEPEVYEALAEMKSQKRNEQILMGLIVAGIFTALIFGYNIWQRDAIASQYQPYVVGAEAGYASSSASTGGGGCCGAGGSTSAATTGAKATGAEAAALAGSTGGAVSAGGCGSGGGCGSAGTPTKLGAAEQQQVETVALAYYAKTYGDAKVTVKIQSFGCHMECYFYKDGKIVKTLIYRGGQFVEK